MNDVYRKPSQFIIHVKNNNNTQSCYYLKNSILTQHAIGFQNIYGKDAPCEAFFK